MKKMKLDQKNKKVAAGIIIIILVLMLIWMVSHNSQIGTEPAMQGTASGESVPGESKEDIVEEDRAGNKKDGTSEGSKGKDSGTGSREDSDDTADEAAILENEGDLEIVIPEDMGTDGF